MGFTLKFKNVRMSEVRIKLASLLADPVRVKTPANKHASCVRTSDILTHSLVGFTLSMS